MTHPITPPPELRSQWFNETPRADIYDYIIEKAAQWGADQELKACCEWLFTEDYDVAPVRLRAARRPKPKTKSPTDKELCEYYTKMYYKSPDRQGPEAQVFALRAVLEHWSNK